MKKICFFIGSMAGSGGTERVTSMIANNFAENLTLEVSILSLNEGLNPFFELNKNITVDELYPKKVSMKKNFINCVLSLRSYVKKNRIDTLIVVDSISCIFSIPALIGLNVQHICWEHFNFNVDLGVPFRKLGRKWAAKYCDYVVTLTKRDKELWEKGLKKINAQIISIANPTPFKNIGNIPSLDDKTVLAVGRLTYQKGFDLLINAWALFCKKNNDWTLRIVGSGEDEEKIKNLAIKLGVENRIDFIPATKKIDQYYRSSSFFCMSSRFEGLPMVLLEAQAYGLPIVAFDCNTGPSELIFHSKNGYLVKSNDINELDNYLQKMVTVDSNDFNEMIKFSFENIKKYEISEIIYHWYDIVGV